MKKTTSDSPGESLKRKNDRLTLDFSGGSKKAWMRGLQDVRGTGDNVMLTSPDVGLLNLTTPELERYIIQPTPTSGLVTTPTQILFPKSVTEEQEAYARGFVDALVELRMKQSPLTANGGIVCFDGQGSSYVALTPVVVPPNTRGNTESNKNNNNNSITGPQLLTSPLFQRPLTLNLSNTLRFLPSVPSFVLSSPVLPLGPSQTSTITSTTAAAVSINAPVHEELGKQPALPAYSAIHQRSTLQGMLGTSVVQQSSSPISNTAPLHSPIDMSNQDTIKLERKREKNRNAAQKCRSKKLERISRLEERATELKTQNAALAATANEQRESVTQLRQQIVDHVNNGCRIMIVRDGATSA